MEYLYNCYTKNIENQTYFFVKKYLAFPEYTNVAPVLESYGMHTDFNKACSIALIFDATLKEQLLNEANGAVPQAKVIDFNNSNYTGKSATS